VVVASLGNGIALEWTVRGADTSSFEFWSMEIVILRSRLLVVNSGVRLLSALFLFFGNVPEARAACCVGQDHAVVLQQRIDSADRLIADGTAIEQRSGILIDRFSRLQNYSSKRKLAASETIDVYGLYESLFKQYEDGLAQYKQHRKDYYAHVQQYHQSQQPVEIVGSNSQIPSQNEDQTAAGFANAAGVLKFKVQDKCTALQTLEGRILANEAQLQGMISDLASSMQTESQSIFADNWMSANQLAIQNSNLAGQYNHTGMQKTAWYSQNVHNFIEEANRDGAYGAHMQAYKDLSSGNAMEAEIFKRCKAHMQRASSSLGELAQMRPSGVSMAAPKPDQAPITADLIQRESNALDVEYANVQDLFGKLESVRKSMPPSFRKSKGIN